jgi:hypothetical protein
MKTKLFDSLKLAFPRFLFGAVGIGCCLGPIVLLNASGSASLGLTAVLVVLLLLCYAVVFFLCLRAKWDALKWLALETSLALGFMIIGLLINEMTGIFIALKAYLVIVYAFVGFLIAELIKPKPHLKVLDEFKRKQTANPIKPAIEGERSEEYSSAELIRQNDQLAKEIAALSSRLEESQRTLAEYEREQRRLLRAQTENQQLEGKFDNLRNQLETSETQLRESMGRIQEVVDFSATLQSEIARLKQQLAEREDAIETLQSAAQHAAKIQTESQELCFENQRLQEELKNHRIQLNASEIRLQESARRNQQVLDRCEHLEAEVVDLKRQLENSQSKAREIESARQQLANVESPEMIYREQQQYLEALIVDLERQLSEGKYQVQVLDDTRQRLRETDRVCQELAEENHRLGEEVSLWRERLAVSEESQRQVSILRRQLDELQTERLINGNRQAQEEFAPGGEPIAVSRLVSDSDGTRVIETTARADLLLDPVTSSAAEVHERMSSEIAIWETNSLNNRLQETRGDQSRFRSGDLPAAIDLEKEEEASWVVWTSVKRKWRVGAVAATIVVIAGAVATGVLGTKFSAPKGAAVSPKTSFRGYSAPKEVAVAPETKFQDSIVEAVSKPQKKPAPRLRGTFETVRPTQVYSGPSENSALIADIGMGMKLNVVDSSYGWLEIRSKHGRPPGFVRQEATVRIAQN